MTSETAEGVVARIRAIEGDVTLLQAALAAELLAANQQQYLARCFDLLHIELTVLRTYINEIGCSVPSTDVTERCD